MLIEHKKSILKEQFQIISLFAVGKQVYNCDVIVRAFEYFATSRSLYNRSREDYQLLSVKRNLTFKVDKIDDDTFIQNVFTNTEEK